MTVLKCSWVSRMIGLPALAVLSCSGSDDKDVAAHGGAAGAAVAPHRGGSLSGHGASPASGGVVESRGGRGQTGGAVGGSADFGGRSSGGSPSLGGRSAGGARAGGGAGAAGSSQGGRGGSGFGGAQAGAAGVGEACGTRVCSGDQTCCNASCSLCAPRGGACIQIACDPSSGGGPATGIGACRTSADCRLFDDYCTGCDCRALGESDPDPICSGPGVRCLVAPCQDRQAACDNGRCVASMP